MCILKLHIYIEVVYVCEVYVLFVYVWIICMDCPQVLLTVVYLFITVVVFIHCASV